jgi:hypothetical protein
VLPALSATLLTVWVPLLNWINNASNLPDAVVVMVWATVLGEFPITETCVRVTVPPATGDFVATIPCCMICAGNRSPSRRIRK